MLLLFHVRVTLVRSAALQDHKYFCSGVRVGDGEGKGKGKVHRRIGHEGPEGEQRYSCTLSLTSALDRGGWSTPLPGRFTPGKETWYPSYRSLGGPQSRFGRVRNISPPCRIDPRTSQPVANHYTD
jgi:hypothetical protein